MVLKEKPKEQWTLLELLERDLAVEGRPAQQIIDFLAPEGVCVNTALDECYMQMAESVDLDDPLQS